MNKAKITFANGDVLFLDDSNEIAPILHIKHEKETFASLGEYKPLYPHIHDGLLPAILDVVCFCDFFTIRDNPETIYCSKSIVSIKSV